MERAILFNAIRRRPSVLHKQKKANSILRRKLLIYAFTICFVAACLPVRVFAEPIRLQLGSALELGLPTIFEPSTPVGGLKLKTDALLYFQSVVTLPAGSTIEVDFRSKHLFAPIATHPQQPSDLSGPVEDWISAVQIIQAGGNQLSAANLKLLNRRNLHAHFATVKKIGVQISPPDVRRLAPRNWMSDTLSSYYSGPYIDDQIWERQCSGGGGGVTPQPLPPRPLPPRPLPPRPTPPWPTPPGPIFDPRPAPPAPTVPPQNQNPPNRPPAEPPIVDPRQPIRRPNDPRQPVGGNGRAPVPSPGPRPGNRPPSAIGPVFPPGHNSDPRGVGRAPPPAPSNGRPQPGPQQGGGRPDPGPDEW